MLIVIHRERVSHIISIMDEMIMKLSETYRDKMRVNSMENYIDISPVRIWFRCGPIWKTAGIRCHIYNTDSSEASKFLAMSAAWIEGVEISDLEEIYKIIDATVNGTKGEI